MGCLISSKTLNYKKVVVYYYEPIKYRFSLLMMKKYKMIYYVTRSVNKRMKNLINVLFLIGLGIQIRTLHINIMNSLLNTN